MPQEIFDAWQTSPFCQTDSCVRIAVRNNQIAISDSKDEDGPFLTFTRAEWDAFAAGVKADAFALD